MNGRIDKARYPYHYQIEDVLKKLSQSRRDKE